MASIFGLVVAAAGQHDLDHLEPSWTMVPRRELRHCPEASSIVKPSGKRGVTSRATKSFHSISRDPDPVGDVAAEQQLRHLLRPHVAVACHRLDRDSLRRIDSHRPAATPRREGPHAISAAAFRPRFRYTACRCHAMSGHLVMKRSNRITGQVYIVAKRPASIHCRHNEQPRRHALHKSAPPCCSARKSRCSMLGTRRPLPPATRCLPPTWRPTVLRWRLRCGCRARMCLIVLL